MMKPARSPDAAQAPASPSFLACLADDVTREVVARVVEQEGWTRAKVQAGGIDVARKLLDDGSAPDLLLIDISGIDDPVAALDQLAEVCPATTRVLSIGATNDVGLYRRLVSMGLVDYLVKPVSAELLQEALLRASRRDKTETGTPARQARVVALVGARGGVGTTTIAAGIGWSMAHQQRLKVALVDLDLHFGNLALAFDLEPGRGLREALEHPERIDSLLLAGAMSGESDRLRILAAEEPLEEALAFDDGSIDPLLQALSPDFDVVVADLPRLLDGIGRRVLAVADAVGIVTDLTLPGMRDTLRLIAMVKSLGSKAKPLVIASRAGSGQGEINRADFEKGISCPLDFAVPFDTKAAAAVAAAGKALTAVAGTSKAAAEMQRLAEKVSGRTTAQKPTFLRRMMGTR